MKQNQIIESTAAMSRGSAATLRYGDGDTVEKVERSIAYMQEHVNEPLQVSTLAAQANVSPSHFFALFKQLTGSPPMDYFTKLRMRRAGRMLDSSTARVKEVAAALGYDDPFYFSRVFKSVHNVPPSRYRDARLNFSNVPERDSLSLAVRM